MTATDTAAAAAAADTAALGLADLGWPVLPVAANAKRPLLPDGFYGASTDRDLIVAWYRRWPTAGIGVRTGPASGLVVVDVDPRHGGDAGFVQATQRLGALPPTLMASTPGGGWHAYFELGADAPLVPSSISKLAPGVDVKADCGYVVVPPAAGRTWTSRRPPAPLPDAWARAMRASPGAIVGGAAPSDRWAKLADGLDEGSRHDGLLRIVGHLLGHGVDVHLVAALVHSFNQTRCSPPYPRADLDRIVDDLAARELAKRRGGRR